MNLILISFYLQAELQIKDIVKESNVEFGYFSVRKFSNLSV